MANSRIKELPERTFLQLSWRT